MSSPRAAPLDLKREHQRLGYSHDRTRAIKQPKATGGSNINWPAFQQRCNALPRDVKKAIVRAAITSATFLPARNSITLAPALITQRERLIRPWNKIPGAYEEAQNTFWSLNTVSITSLSELKEMVAPVLQAQIKRLYIAHEPDMEGEYNHAAVTGVVHQLRAALVKMRELEFLAVAVVYDDLEARLAGADEGEEVDELKVVVEAVGRLTGIKEKVVLLKDVGHEDSVGEYRAARRTASTELKVEMLLSLAPADKGLLV